MSLEDPTVVAQDAMSHAESEVELQPATAAQDFGNVHSKLAMAHKKPDGSPGLTRVPWTGDLDDPEYPDDNSEFEFVACAALAGPGELVEGRRALDSDESMHLKTIFVFLALSQGRHRNEIVSLLPDGPRLIRAVAQEAITEAMMYTALTAHFTRLHRMVQAQLARSFLFVTTLVITYPNYLFENENTRDFDQFIDFYYRLIKPIWGNIHYRVCSEGQAVAVYLCVPFVDSISGQIRKQVEQLFSHLRKASWVNLIIVDSGSSSVNIQSMCVWFDQHGKMSHSQSYVQPGQRDGVQSGSHLANSEVRKIVVKALEDAREVGYEVSDGDVAGYLQNFERQKKRRGFNYVKYTAEQQQLSLHSHKGCQLRIELKAKRIEKVFDAAFNKGLKALKATLDKYLTSEPLECSDMAVLFCGGSYISEGLRVKVKQVMQTFESKARAKLGIAVKWDFLTNLEKSKNWQVLRTITPAGWSPLTSSRSTAVCAGAALGELTMPRLADLIRGLTIGLQVVRRVRVPKSTKTRWVGANEAQVLLSAGDRLRHVDIKPSDRHRLNLVCDPAYRTQRGSEGASRLPNIMIDPAKRSTGGQEDIPPYDLGCCLRVRDLPDAATVRIALGGRRLQALSEGRTEEAIVDESLPIILRCYAVTQRGKPLKDPQDKKYVLRLRPDPGSKLPIVAQEEDFLSQVLPFWCSVCNEEITTATAERCCECVFNICQSCQGQPHQHERNGHVLEVVQMDY